MSFVKEGGIDRAKKASAITVNQSYFTVIRGKSRHLQFFIFFWREIIIPIFIITQTACRLQNKAAYSHVSVQRLSEGFQSLFHFILIALPFITGGQETFPEVKRSAHSQDKVGGLQLFPTVMYYSVKAMIR